MKPLLPSVITREVDRRRAVRHDANLDALRERLESLEAGCLTSLGAGLTAMARGDLTFAAQSTTAPLAPCGDAGVDAVADVFNRTLARAQASVRAFNAMREDLRARLGDSSSLERLEAGMQGVAGADLATLCDGLGALAAGEPAGEAEPATGPLEASRGAALGSLAETFNAMLARAHDGLGLLAEVPAVAPEPVRQPEAAARAEAKVVPLLLLPPAADEDRRDDAGDDIDVEAAADAQHATQTNLLALNAAIEAARVVDRARNAFIRIGESVCEMTMRIEQILNDAGVAARAAELPSAGPGQATDETREATPSEREIASSAELLARSAQELDGLVTRLRIAA